MHEKKRSPELSEERFFKLSMMMLFLCIGIFQRDTVVIRALLAVFEEQDKQVNCTDDRGNYK